ncbi:MAG: DUF222 domain-containing protein, partial [Candidatus Dormibacteria bacterium]
MCDGVRQLPRWGTEVADVFAAATLLRGRTRNLAPESCKQDLLDLTRAINMLELERATIAATFDDESTDLDWGESTNAYNWIRHECKLSGVATSRALSVGRSAHQLRESVQALISGSIGFGHLGLIASTAESVATNSGGNRSLDETQLLRLAQEHSVGKFMDDCDHVRHAADSAVMLHDQLEAAKYRRLELRQSRDTGRYSIHGSLDAVGGATLRSALEPLAKRNGHDDMRLREQRLADAAVELANHAMDSGMLPTHKSQRPHLHLTASVQTIAGMDGAPAAQLEYWGPVHWKTAQRLSCDSSVIRVLMGGESAVLDVGRARRMPSAATLRAVKVRDKGCVWPG